MLLQTGPSPTARLCWATFPCGLRIKSEAILVSRIAHQNSTGSAGKSTMGGKSSLSGCSVANTASNHFGGTGSMITRLPEDRNGGGTNFYPRLTPSAFLRQSGSPSRLGGHAPPAYASLIQQSTK